MDDKNVYNYLHLLEGIQANNTEQELLERCSSLYQKGVTAKEIVEILFTIRSLNLYEKPYEVVVSPIIVRYQMLVYEDVI